MGLQASSVVQLHEHLPARALQNVYLYLFLQAPNSSSWLKLSEDSSNCCLPTALRKTAKPNLWQTVHRSFVICHFIISSFISCHSLSFALLWSSYTELLLVHQMSHTLCFSPGSFLYIDFSLWPEHVPCSMSHFHPNCLSSHFWSQLRLLLLGRIPWFPSSIQVPGYMLP